MKICGFQGRFESLTAGRHIVLCDVRELTAGIANFCLAVRQLVESERAVEVTMPQRRPAKVKPRTFDAVAAGAFLQAHSERLELSPRAAAKLAKVSGAKPAAAIPFLILLHITWRLRSRNAHPRRPVNAHQALEVRLTDGRLYLTADHFTVLDAYVWATMWHKRSGAQIDHLGRLMAWKARVDARASAQKALKDEAAIVAQHRAKAA